MDAAWGSLLALVSDANGAPAVKPEVESKIRAAIARIIAQRGEGVPAPIDRHELDAFLDLGVTTTTAPTAAATPSGASADAAASPSSSPSPALPIFDVRAPAEFATGHIPGASSFPLFSDAERARVGTAYKRVSHAHAIAIGMEVFAEAMEGFVRRAQEMVPRGSGGSAGVAPAIRVHCWRGGMRSQAIGWLLNLAGYRVHLLTGGYRAYRRWAQLLFESPRPYLLLGGLTGSGKTVVLQSLAAMGEPVIDLEGLAHHKGSSFGAIGQKPQPTREQFENELALQLHRLPSPLTHVWVEDESRSIGSVPIPEAVWTQMREAPMVVLEVPRDVRTRKLTAEYCAHDPQLLREAILRIERRLGGLATTQALAAIDAGNFERMVELALVYYDRMYSKGIDRRNALHTRTIHVNSPACDADTNAKLVREVSAQAMIQHAANPAAVGAAPSVPPPAVAAAPLDFFALPPLSPAVRSLLRGYSHPVPVHVAWSEQDIFGHVNNARYVTWAESARIRWLNSLAEVKFKRGAADLPAAVEAFMTGTGSAGPILKSSFINHRASVTYPDVVVVGSRLRWVRSDRFSLSHRMVSLKDSCVVAEVEGIIVAVDYKEQGGKVEIPALIRAAMEQRSKERKADDAAQGMIKPPRSCANFEPED